MAVILFAGLLIIGGLLNFIGKLKAGAVCHLSKYYLVFTLIVCISTWLFYFGGIKYALISNALAFVLKWGFYISPLVLEYLIGYLFFSIRVKDAISSNHKLRMALRTTLWAASILTASTFWVATVGKAENMGYMLSFFKTSGYAVWFLYFIMTAESLAALGILLHFKLKTGPSATAGLMLIMAGAVFTHIHNKDPFSDSFAAIIQFITLSLLMTLYYFEKQAGHKTVAAAI